MGRMRVVPCGVCQPLSVGKRIEQYIIATIHAQTFNFVEAGFIRLGMNHLRCRGISHDEDL